MNDKPIGILDSGIGGLTVAKEIIELLPHESIIYIGDSANTPYGTKTKDEIYSRARELINFLLKKEVKIIVIACNTITVSCIDQLRKDYHHVPIVGAVPVVKTAAEVTVNKRIGILSTTQTAKSDYQKKIIAEFANDCAVFNYGTDGLVPLIEKGITYGKEIDEQLENVLDKFKKEKIDTLALGCTHYPLIATAIQEHLGKHVHLLNSGAAIARRVKQIIENNQIATKTNERFYDIYTTGQTTVIRKIMTKLDLIDLPIKIQETAL